MSRFTQMWDISSIGKNILPSSLAPCLAFFAVLADEYSGDIPITQSHYDTAYDSLRYLHKCVQTVLLPPTRARIKRCMLKRV